jgi:hypothetical protein
VVWYPCYIYIYIYVRRSCRTIKQGMETIFEVPPKTVNIYDYAHDFKQEWAQERHHFFCSASTMTGRTLLSSLTIKRFCSHPFALYSVSMFPMFDDCSCYRQRLVRLFFAHCSPESTINMEKYIFRAITPTHAHVFKNFIMKRKIKEKSWRKGRKFRAQNFLVVRCHIACIYISTISH